MPLYEYRCDNCGELFEVRQKFADEPLSTHEKCGGHVERLVSAPTFQFQREWLVRNGLREGRQAIKLVQMGIPAKRGRTAKIQLPQKGQIRQRRTRVRPPPHRPIKAGVLPLRRSRAPIPSRVPIANPAAKLL